MRQRWSAVLCLLASACGFAPHKSDAASTTPERGSYSVAALGGLTMSYLRAGTRGGTRVIFVHGTPGEADGWSGFLAAVPAGFEYFAVDRPGFGHTLPVKAEPSLAKQAAALVPLLDARSPAILVGHSYGGPVIAQLAVDHPGGIASLVIAAGALDPAQEKVHPMQPVGEWWGVRSMLPSSMRNANRELLALKGELERLEPRLNRVTLPVTIVHGTSDTLVPFANVAYMQQRFSGSGALETIVLDGQGHFLPWEHRPVIERAIQKLAGR